MYLVNPFNLSLPMKNNPNHEYINLLIVKKFKKWRELRKLPYIWCYMGVNRNLEKKKQED